MSKSYYLFLLLFISCSSETDFPADKIVELQHMPTPRYGFASGVYNNKIYVFGGFCNNGQVNVSSNLACKRIESYSVNNNEWKLIDEIPELQMGSTSVVHENKIYSFGGYPCETYFQIFDMDNGIASFFDRNTLLYNGTSTIFNNVIYFIGGDCSNSGINFNAGVSSYDIINDRFQEELDIPDEFIDNLEEFTFINAILFEEDIYVWYINNLFRFNLIEKEWYQVDTDVSYLKHFQEGLVYKNKILFFGGSDSLAKGSSTSKDINIFDPHTNSWSIIKDALLYGRHYRYKVHAIDTTIYILGGRDPETWEPMNNLVRIPNLEI